MLRMPITDPLPSTTHATNTHDQSTAVQTQPCAHKPQAHALHMRNCCSRTRTDRTHAPSTQHVHVRNVAQWLAQPILPHLGTPQNDHCLPASSSRRSRVFLGTNRSSTLIIVANARCADAIRSAAPASPQPAAAAAAPAQLSPRALRCCPATLRELTRAPRSHARHVPYPYPFSTNWAREEGVVDADYVTRSGGGTEPSLEVPLLEGEIKA